MTMKMKYLLAGFCTLLLAVGASAQQQPERSLVRKGNRQYNKGNYDPAIKRYEEALKIVPGQFEATYNMGNALYKAKRYDKAAETLQQAAADSLRTDAERAHAFYNLGNAQFQQKKYQEALESYKQSLRLNPADRETKYNYAYTKHLLDQNKNKNGGGGGGGNNDKNKDQKKDQNKDQNKDQQNKDNKNQQNKDNQNQQNQQNQQNPQSGKDQQNKQGQPQQAEGQISPQEQQQILDAIQAQEDKTQEKLKEQKGVVVRGKKNW